MSKHIVLCWELGAALGHVMGFRHLIEALLAEQCKVSIIVRNTITAQQVLGDLDITTFQCPIYMSDKEKRLSATHSFSDILFDLGYGSKEALTGLTKAWIELFRLLKPDLLVCDHSPTALLAAKCLNLPSATYGIGYFVPPASKQAILFKSVDTATEKEIAKRHRSVVANINHFLQGFARQKIESCSDIFTDSHHFLCTYPELDHYSRDKDTPYTGPRFSITTGKSVKLKKSKRIVFVYLKADSPHLAGVVQALGQLNKDSILFIPNVTTEIAKLVKRYKCLALYDSPINISSIFAQTDMVICNAGHGLVSAALINRKRVLLIPTHLEQNVLTQKLTQQKLCTALAKTSTHNLESLITFTLNNALLGENIAKFADKYDSFDQDAMLRDVARKCVSIAK